MARHKGEYYNVVRVGDIGSLVLVLHDTPVAKEEEEEEAQIDPDFDDDQSQKEDSEDTNLEKVLEELEGSSSGIHSSHVHNLVTREQAAKYEISRQEAA